MSVRVRDLKSSNFNIFFFDIVLDVFCLLLCVDLLGGRLEKEMDGAYRDNAALCYICSGNVDKFVECW